MKGNKRERKELIYFFLALWSAIVIFFCFGNFHKNEISADINHLCYAFLESVRRKVDSFSCFSFCCQLMIRDDNGWEEKQVLKFHIFYGPSETMLIMTFISLHNGFGIVKFYFLNKKKFFLCVGGNFFLLLLSFAEKVLLPFQPTKKNI